MLVFVSRKSGPDFRERREDKGIMDQWYVALPTFVHVAFSEVMTRLPAHMFVLVLVFTMSGN